MKYLLFSLNTILLVSLIGVLYFSIHNNSIGIPQIREKYAELFFADHLKLPKIIKERGNISFAFIVDNKEGKRKGYEYTVNLFDDKGIKTEISKGKISIDKDKSEKVSINFSLPDNFNHGKVEVELLNPPQAISFSLTFIPEQKL